MPAGKPAASASTRVVAAGELAFDVRHDVHDVAVALDEELVGDRHAADLGDAADVVAAEIEQHQVLGALLRVGEQFVFQRLVLVRGFAARARAGDRADRDGAAAHAHQDFRARARDREAAEVEEDTETATG